MKIVFRCLLLAGLGLSVLTVGASWWLEKTLSRQPVQSVGSYSVPLKIKSGVHYVTPRQKAGYLLIEPSYLLALLLAGIGAAGGAGNFKRRKLSS